MTEERKHAILLAVTILTARKMMPIMDDESGKPNMAQDFWAENYVLRGITLASKILEKIDERWPGEGKADVSSQ